MIYYASIRIILVQYIMAHWVTNNCQLPLLLIFTLLEVLPDVIHSCVNLVWGPGSEMRYRSLLASMSCVSKQISLCTMCMQYKLK